MSRVGGVGEVVCASTSVFLQSGHWRYSCLSLQSCDCGRRVVRFVILTLEVVTQNDREYVDVIYLQLTSQSRDYFEKLVVPHLVSQFLACYGNQNSITFFTRDFHYNQWWARWIHSYYRLLFKIIYTPTYEKFCYALLNFRMYFLVNDQLDEQIPFNVFTRIYLFTTLYMFRARRAHHQERQIVPMQLLVTVTLYWWQCRVLVGNRVVW